jgi:hypothetical protein
MLTSSTLALPIKKEEEVAPYEVTYQNVPDEIVSDLLKATNALGLGTPLLSPVGLDTQPTIEVPSPRPPRKLAHSNGDADLPVDWKLVREIPNQSYAWPMAREEYETYRIYAGTTAAEGVVHIALGQAPRTNTWGQRPYTIAFLSSGSPQTPLVEFLATDDYENTHGLVAVIRGSDGGKKMYGPGDPLPSVYAHNFTTVLFRDQVNAPRAWSKMAVLVHEGDTDAILNHALLQARRRGDL